MSMNSVAGGVKLEAAVTAFYSVPEAAFNNPLTPLGDLVASHVPCNGTSFEIDSLGAIPAVQEIVGTRPWAALRAYVNHGMVKKYGPPGLELKLIDIENDPTGMVAKKLADYLASANNYLENPLWSFLFTLPTCIDTSALISTTHGFGAAGATWSNKSTNALSPAEFFTMISAMGNLVYESGVPAGYSVDTLMVGFNNEKMGFDLVGMDRVVPIAATGLENYSAAVAAAAKSNFASSIKLVVNPWITGSTYGNYWFGLDTKRKGVSPIYVGDAQPMKAYAVTDPASAPMMERSCAAFYAEAYNGLLGGVPYPIYGGIV